jgi:hypothetical protein
MARQFLMTWPDFKISVAAELMDEKNKNICDVFWAGLPLKTIFAASMSAGEMFKIPLPFPLPTLPPDKCPAFPTLPAGTIVQLPYGGIMLKYGVCAEPFQVPELAKVMPEDMPKLIQASIKLRDAYFFTKVVNICTISRKE